MGSVGKLYPNMEAKIVDEEGREVAEGEVCLHPQPLKLDEMLTGGVDRRVSSGLRAPTFSRGTSTIPSGPKKHFPRTVTSRQATSFGVMQAGTTIASTDSRS